ncbi:hypothetical protein CLDAP_19180 [Caldilinea aerophila DSM 14535 = NBRC 104270]|uniref:Uncharacterized protein n=1 Tax=Caldilinea aerophila (strain DSM 14535 / JCM 11387 / NBRC 104270 / STL-6-O1) TaxID=926550 RepID=I0I3X0_CALAS|nr:hypothetical protein CLDAP_19180 [Caldilinea aerophila DSM 14535 = NBRC 104270]
MSERLHRYLPLFEGTVNVGVRSVYQATRICTSACWRLILQLSAPAPLVGRTAHPSDLLR